MGQSIELSGLSGQSYRYTHLADETAVPSQAANVVVAEHRRGRWRILYVSQTDYLPRNDWRPILDQIRARIPQVQLLYRLNIAHAVREAEAEDIRQLHQPPAEPAEAA